MASEEDVDYQAAFKSMSEDLYHVLFPKISTASEYFAPSRGLVYISILHKISRRLHGRPDIAPPGAIILHPTGSQFELPGLVPISDTDVMACMGVVGGNGGTKSAALLPQNAKHPGFIQLHDATGNIHGHADMPKLLKNTDLGGFYDHGPAKTMTQTLEIGQEKVKTFVAETDFVRCYSFSDWPAQAAEWPHRARPHDWPTRKMIETIITHETHLVAIGHPLSEDPTLEWRLSFSFAERYLLQSLSGEQLLSHFLARRILKSVRQDSDKIPSFFLKTMLLWHCEEKSGSYWQPNRIVFTARDILRRLIEFLRSFNLPNYFVPENNMIDHLPRENVRDFASRLEEALHHDKFSNEVFEVIRENGFTVDPRKLKRPQEWSLSWLPFPIFNSTAKSSWEATTRSKVISLAAGQVFDAFRVIFLVIKNMENVQEYAAMLYAEGEPTSKCGFQKLKLACWNILKGFCLEHDMIDGSNKNSHAESRKFYRTAAEEVPELLYSMEFLVLASYFAQGEFTSAKDHFEQILCSIPHEDEIVESWIKRHSVVKEIGIISRALPHLTYGMLTVMLHIKSCVLLGNIKRSYSGLHYLIKVAGEIPEGLTGRKELHMTILWHVLLLFANTSCGDNWLQLFKLNSEEK